MGGESMLRSVILHLADQQGLCDAAMRQPLARRFALRFVAGEHLEDAVAVVHGLNSRGIRATLDHLGENVTNADEAARAADEYLEVIHRVAETGIDTNVSLKLTQMGLSLGDEVCLHNLERVVARAAARNSFVRVDMEGSAYTQRTLDIIRRLHSRYDNSLGPVIQAYLYRSKADVEDLIRSGMRVRLCKGAYNEPTAVSFPRKRDADASFRRLAELLLLCGNYPAIATHDEKLIRWSQRFAKQNGISTARFEFQMLYGIRRDLQESLASAGNNVRVYVPYGTHWYPYLMRRLAERPENLVFLLSNLLRG